MHILTWNMGCAFQGSKYRAAHGHAWEQIEALNPDIALLQEVSEIPPGLTQRRSPVPPAMPVETSILSCTPDGDQLFGRTSIPTWRRPSLVKP